MTNKEYKKWYKKARSECPKMTRRAMVEVFRTYKQAAREVSALVRTASPHGLEDVSSSIYGSLQRQLEKSAQDVFDTLNNTLPSTTRTTLDISAKIHTQYIDDALKVAGSSITKTAITEAYSAVNDGLVKDLISRISQKGYTFTERIWNTANDLPAQLNRVVSAGLAQNRDVLKIAKDISVYTNDGKTALIKRYGKLKRGTLQFSARISDKIDYRALRLVRSELYMSLQNSSVEQAKANPAADGEFDWVLTSGGDHSCKCADLASGSPYGEHEVPVYPHPNCRCTIRPRLMDREKFNTDLKRWVGGESVPYIDDWHRKYVI